MQRITYRCKGRTIMQEGELLGRRCRKDGHFEDLTDLVGDVPADGKVHRVKCPVCGNKSKVFKGRTPSEG